MGKRHGRKSLLDVVESGDRARGRHRPRRRGGATPGRRRAPGRGAAPAGRRPRPRTRYGPATTSSTRSSTSSKRRPICGCSWSWRSSTRVSTWRVTSPCWPHPATSLWHSSGTRLAHAGRLGVLVALSLPALGGHGADRRRRRRSAGTCARSAGPAARPHSRRWTSWSRRRCSWLDGRRRRHRGRPGTGPSSSRTTSERHAQRADAGTGHQDRGGDRESRAPRRPAPARRGHRPGRPPPGGRRHGPPRS